MEYFGDVSRHHCSYTIVQRTFPDDTDLSLSNTEEKIREAIGQLQDGKAQGPGGISAELLKLDGADTIC